MNALDNINSPLVTEPQTGFPAIEPVNITPREFRYPSYINPARNAPQKIETTKNLDEIIGDVLEEADNFWLL
mgnify:CR=1 FL=1